MSKIQIKCPSCFKIGYIEVSENIAAKSDRGIIAIRIEENKICSHSFIVYLDKNLHFRDSFLVDFHIKLPELKNNSMKRKIPDSKVLDIYLIKLNIHALTLTFIIRSCFFKRKVLFLIDEKFLHDHINQFFNFIFKNSFEVDISIKSSKEYEKSKNSYKDFIILDKEKIIRDKNKLLKPKKIKIERSVVQRFLAETSPKISLIMLKNDILKIFNLSKEIMELIRNYEGKEKLGKIKLINMLEKKEIQISSLYLEFLLEIIEKYFNFDLSNLSSFFVNALGI